MDLLPGVLLVCILASEMLFTSAAPAIDDMLAVANACDLDPACQTLPDHPALTELDIAVPPAQTRRRKKRKGLINQAYRWPNNVVPYTLEKSANFTHHQEGIIRAAMDFLGSRSCLTFVERTTESDYITIISDGGCYSYVGRIGGAQRLSLAPGCRVGYIVEHEVLHALGLIHEQSRNDRDSYITIEYANIQSGRENNFNKWAPASSIYDFDTRYDYASVMHYGPYGFSKNGKPTITTNDVRFQSIIGKMYEPSFTDLKILNRMYDCAAGCPGSCSGYPRAYMDRNCDCICPGNDEIYGTLNYGLCSALPDTTTVESTTVEETTTMATTTTTESACENTSNICYIYIFFFTYEICAFESFRAGCRLACLLC